MSSTSESTAANARSSYRVVYPASERPRLTLGDGSPGRLLDCSENGLRYRLREGRPLPAEGTVVAGEVQFRAAGRQAFRGTVVRVVDGDVALLLAPPGLALRALFDEQRALRARFPGSD